MLGLRTCKKDGSSYGGFKWSLEVGAIITAHDWNSKPECGGGLHFLPWGEGDAKLINWDDDSIGLVIEPIGDDVVEILNPAGKSKCRSAQVVMVGPVKDCATYIYEHGGAGKLVNGCTATAGDGGTATAGEYGTATAGEYGTATAGEYGTATASDGGTATAGRCGTATAGRSGTATAGDEGTIIIKHWNGKRYKFTIAYVGEDGIEPNVKYCLDDDGKFIKAEVAA